MIWKRIAPCLLFAYVFIVPAMSFGEPKGTYNMGVQRFTTVPFKNAPESIIRVVSSKRISSDEVVVDYYAVGCHPPRGVVYTMRVTNARGVTFRKGEYLLTGVAAPPDGPPSIRYVSDSERSALCREGS